MKSLLLLVPYLFVHFIAFYVLPNFATNTSTSILLLLFIIPLVCLLSAIHYGTKYQFNGTYLIMVVILFTPSVIIFYNYTAYFYIIIYGAIAVLGNLMGYRIAIKKGQ